MGRGYRPELDLTPADLARRERELHDQYLESLVVERKAMEERGKADRVAQIDAELTRARKAL